MTGVRRQRPEVSYYCRFDDLASVATLLDANNVFGEPMIHDPNNEQLC
jgi:hypothetical protein